MANRFYACLRTHHLLDHKPDNLLRTGHKHGLVGFYKFGTPGIAVLFATDEHCLHNFLDVLQSAMPQKKFGFVIWREDFEGDAPSQWNEMSSAAELKQAMAATGVDEDDYFTVLGIEKREEESQGAKSGGKKGKGSKVKPPKSGKKR